MNVKPIGALSPLNRRQALLLSAGTAASLALPAAMAQGPSGAYPDRPVKIVVPFAPGAGTDAMARLVAQKLGEVLNASFVVDNRAGASGAIGTQFVAQSPADGYTLLLVASPFTTVAASLPSANYDPLRQFTPVGMIASGPLVWAANTKLPANNMKELVSLAKQKPGALNYGSAGAGGGAGTGAGCCAGATTAGVGDAGAAPRPPKPYQPAAIIATPSTSRPTQSHMPLRPAAGWAAWACARSRRRARRASADSSDEDSGFGARFGLPAPTSTVRSASPSRGWPLPPGVTAAAS